jgi:glycyl-tRNA synthetase
VLTMQDALTRLDGYWTGRGCLRVQPMNTEVGAGTLNPATFLRVLGPEPWRVAYVEPSVRPDDARYGENPNRIQCHTQYQVILKPEPGDAQQLYLGSLEALGIDVRAHDVRFVEDNWASPALGAWGLGWEVWLDGLEITQFTYFQQAGGIDLDPVSVEITYGVERIVMALQGVRHFKDIGYAPGISYGEVFGQAEYEMSRYYLDDADVAANRSLLETYAAEVQRMIEARLPVPAHSYVLKCSHAFNVLDARGAVSTAERAAEFTRMRRLSGSVAQLWIERRADLGHPHGATPAPEAARPALQGVASTADRPRQLVFEIGTEELPPTEAQAARDQLTRLVVDALAGTRLPHGALTVLATPRRLVAIVDEVAGRETDHTRLVRGPKVNAAFGPDGAPTPAASGFARAHGVAVGDLERADVNGVEHLVVRRHEPGRPVLEALSGALAGLRAAKNMRWRDPLLTFTRPIRWLLALWGDDVVPVRASTLATGRTTWVLRTAAEPVLTVGAAEEYLDHLHAAGILLDPTERRDRIVAAATELAATVGGCIDTGGESALIDQLTYLIESPTPLLGRFDPDYLWLPEAVLATVMRAHQRYLPVRDTNGALLPCFVTVANGPIDAEVVRAGNEAVLRARYEDAAFFYRADLAVAPAQLRQRLTDLTFADRLGSMHDRADRIAAVAAELADLVGLDDQQRRTLDRARNLTKFDLGSQLVTELTSLAGVMAGEYAIAAGEPPAVAQALYEAELPRHAGGHLPTTSAGAILSLADRLDYLAGLATTVGLPTGSSDPFALRRAALGALALHRTQPALSELSLVDALTVAARHQPLDVPLAVIDDVAAFLTRRLEQLLAEEGRPLGHIRAALVHAARPARTEAILTQLAALAGAPDFDRLVQTMQRARRIVPPGTAPHYDPGVLAEPAEIRLHDTLGKTRATLDGITDLDHYTGATADLTHAVAEFFDQVGRRDAPRTDGDDDPIERAVLCGAELPVRAEHAHIAVSRGRQAGVGAVDHLLIDVDRGHRAIRPGQLPKQRGVVAAAADLQNPLPRSHLELAQHHGDDRRRGDRADVDAALVPLRDDGVIGVRLLQRHPRHEEVPGHDTQRGFDPL